MLIPKHLRKNTYYKGVDTRFMSGRALPTEPSYDKDFMGVVKSVHFVNCSFHPQCTDALFVDCVFTECDGVHHLQEAYCLENCEV